MPQPHLEFWFEFASTYSYVAASRVPRLAGAAGVPVVYRPFLLGPVFGAQGLTDSPFNVYPVKGAYMWRDMERLCADEGLAMRRPSVFPRNGLLGARAAIAVGREPWLPDFVLGVYTANFAEDLEISKPEIVARVLRGLGQDPEPVLARTQDQDVKDTLRANTDEAMAKGIFGAPTFTVGTEVFWGNDRLDHALAWAAR